MTEKTHDPSWWVRQPQEKDGNYYFSGRFLVTPAVQELLSEDEIFFIYLEVLLLARVHNGLDYLQVFLRETDGRKLFFIDQLARWQIQSGLYRQEDDCCVLMLAEEY